MVCVGSWKDIYLFSWCVYKSSISTYYTQSNLVKPLFAPAAKAKPQSQILDLGTAILGVTKWKQFFNPNT